jgi:hypothetical protein
MAYSKGNRSIRNAWWNARQTQVDYFYKCRNVALLALCTYSRSPQMHLQHSRHYSVSSHNQTFPPPLLARPLLLTAHWRTRFFQLVLLLISRSTVGVAATGFAELTGLQSGQSSYRGSILGKGKQFYCFPKPSDRIWGRPTFLFTGYQGFFPRGKATVTWSWPLVSI